MHRSLAIKVRHILLIYLQSVLLIVKTLRRFVVVPLVGEENGARLILVVVEELDRKSFDNISLTLVLGVLGI